MTGVGLVSGNARENGRGKENNGRGSENASMCVVNTGWGMTAADDGVRL